MQLLSIPRFRPSFALSDGCAFLRAALPQGSSSQSTFERAFGQKCLDGRTVLLAPSARIALYWLLRALGLGGEDEVVTQAFNFPAVPAAIIAAGCTPRFLDLAPDGFEADWEKLGDSITSRTRAVIVTHLFGNPAQVEAVMAQCEKRGVLVIEDCAQGIGATASRRPVGTFGTGAIFSLGPTKNLTLRGGGAVASGDANLSQALETLARQHAQVGLGGSLRLAVKALALTVATRPIIFSSFVLPVIRALERRGIDFVHRVMEEAPGKLEGIAASRKPSRGMAAVGVAQLRRLEALNRARVRNGWYLRKALADLAGLTVPQMPAGSVFMSFPVLHARREALARELRRRGVDTDFGFMSDCSTLDLFAGARMECPQSARVAREILHLPVHPFLRKRHLDSIAGAVREAVRSV